MNLWEKLQIIERIAQGKPQFPKIQKRLISNLIEEKLPVHLLEKEDTSALQKAVIELQIEKYNGYLKDALDGRKTISCSLYSLEEEGEWNKWNGLIRYLPRKRDVTYNKKVDELGDLITTYHLKKRGILFPDNIATLSLAGFGGLSYYMMNNMYQKIEEAGQISGLTSSGEIALPAILALVYTVIFGSVAHFTLRGSCAKELPFQKSRIQAQYLDEKIKELF